MKILGVHRCLVSATVSVLTTLSWAATAQENQQYDEQTQQQGQQEQQQAPRRLFVSDKLVLNVYAEADQGSARVGTLETGDAVDELERSANFIRVRLDSGSEGWVGANYLTKVAPAAVRVRELEREQKTALQAAEKKSADEIARLMKESAALQSQVNALKSAATSAPGATIHNTAASAPAPAIDNAVTAPEKQAPEIQKSGPTAESVALIATKVAQAVWMWLLIIVLTACLAFAAGYRTLDRRLRKKFGGLKLY